MSGYDGLSEITANVCQVDYINAKSRVSDKCPGGGDWYERGWGPRGLGYRNMSPFIDL